jgi:hypothetical protein
MMRFSFAANVAARTALPRFFDSGFHGRFREQARRSVVVGADQTGGHPLLAPNHRIHSYMLNFNPVRLPAVEKIGKFAW